VTDQLRIALAQLNPKVGDLPGNLALARKALADAVAAKADILMFSELFLTGYFPDDLLFKAQFVTDAMAAAQTLAAETAGTDVVLVLPTIWKDQTGRWSLPKKAKSSPCASSASCPMTTYSTKSAISPPARYLSR
jgi:NAD+ synthase